MIKLFRKIRQQLISENTHQKGNLGGRFIKYLMYASGEIVLVVIGILIAIQLNAWQTEAENNNKVLKYLDGLYAELTQDYERMDSIYTFYSEKTNAIQLLLKSVDQEFEFSNADLGTMFNSVLEHKKFSNKKSTYLSLINDGFINQVKDKDLVNEIIKYYESPYLTWSTEIYGNILESIDYNQSERYHSEDGLILLNKDNSIPGWEMTNKYFQTNYAELMHSRWATNILTSFLKQSDFIFKNLEGYKEMNVHLRNEIEVYKKES